MIEIHFERLRSLGLTNAVAAVAATLPLPDAAAGTPPPRLVRVTEVHRETLRVHDGERDCSARVLPRLARTLQDQETAIAVGDWAVLACETHGQAWVHERVPPLSHVARRDADGRRHPVVSNVDWALLVMGLDDDFNLRRLERYLALVHGGGIAPVVVLSKADVLAGAPDLLAQRLAQVRARASAQVDVLAVDCTTPAAAAALAPYLGAGQTLVLLGSSGAGKSTLTNTLLGAAVQDTGAVREHDSRGKHTTTARSLHRLPSGACVIDTPGLRALRPDVDETTLAASFGDIGTLASACRFRDCRHQDEPGCAVREGIDGDRLRNYHKLLREARRDTMSVLERQQMVAVWKVRGKAGKARAKAKRGGDVGS
jgi:ribosome biogenesis GTPase / thiamine phosphate phosphatase